MNKELEAIVWCPKCQKEEGKIYRVRASNEGVYMHVTEPLELAGKKQCECGAVLERKQ